MNDELALVADIGGTNARFALVAPTAGELRLLDVHSLANADFASVQHAAEHYLALTGARPRQAAIAVACPVAGDAIRLTNRAWAFSREELRHSLGLARLEILNDFGAIARAVPRLRAGDRTMLHGDDADTRHGPVSVLGPGTGLGVGLLVGDAAGGWQVVETEGGHVSFAALGDEEQAIARWVGARHGRCSTERLVSGQGLAYIDAALAGRPFDLDAGALRPPEKIVDAALDGHDLDARRCLARFCAILGSVAGDTALIQGARAVAIAGGIVPRFVPFVRSSAFRERFLAKGRFAAHLAALPIFVVTHPAPGLLGAATALA